MKMQLLRVVLWSRNPAHEPRIVEFFPGAVNVVTGASKTGKSAVIPVIDYCLGSDGCSIPVRTIRDACSWFGILLRTEEGEILLARREPGKQASTSEMFVVEGEKVEIPARIEAKNTTADHVKRKLDRLAGLSTLGFDPDNPTSGYRGRPAFRDLVAFVFQPQNVVANPDVLFYKSDTTEHKEKLKTIFPYVLGAMTPELLAKQWAADKLRDELRRKEREMNAVVKTSEKWRSELQSWASDARDRGLIADEQYESAVGESELLDLLRVAIAKTSRQAVVTEEAVEHSSREAAELDREESEIALCLAGVRRMEHIQSLRASVDDYTGGLSKQRDRLSLARWLRERCDDESSCPLCGGKYDSAHRELDELCDALADIEASSRQLSIVPAVFDRELLDVRGEVHDLTDRLEGVRARRRHLEERDLQLAKGRLDASEVDRFLGRLEQGLVMFESLSADTTLQDAVDEIRAQYNSLRSELRKSGWEAKFESLLTRLSQAMGRILPLLDAETPDDPVTLSVENLTLEVLSQSGRRNSLWEIGSGANWLAYHVALVMGLQRLFREQVANPVPSLVAFDQPSQVYFPRKLAGVGQGVTDAELRDEDVTAVRKVFELLGSETKAASGGLQVLVLDHAGEEVWGGVDGVRLVEEWRHGRALVPLAWLEADAELEVSNDIDGD